MHAALVTGLRKVEFREFPEPAAAPGVAVVEVQLCGICGTDVHAYASGDPYNPAICGHEWTGVVSAVGPDVQRIEEGDRVVAAVPPACGTCDACRAGHTTHCVNSFLCSLGLDSLAPPHGGFAPRIAVDARRLVAANPALTVEDAAQVEPAAVAIHAVRRTQPRLGDLAIVQGAGPIGLITLQFVRAGGAGAVVVVEPNEARRALATRLGATYAVAPGEESEVVAELSNGLGADVVYECVGRPETVQKAVDLSRRGGRMCLIGLAHGSAPIAPAVWLIKEIEVNAALAYTHDDFDRAMGMIADGRVALAPVHTATIGFDELDDAFADLASGHSTQTKVLVRP